MPTAETLRSLIGLLETEPQESKFEFIVEPSGDLYRTISHEDETNFYMENDTLPLDFNDIFEVNRAPSSFHGKIQATLGSLFQDCLLNNVGIEDKDHMVSDRIEEPYNVTTFNCDEPVFKVYSEEVDKAEFVNHTEGFKGEQSCSDIKETFLELGIASDFTAKKRNLDNVPHEMENGVLVSSNVVDSDPSFNGETGANVDLTFHEIWNTFTEFENSSTFGKGSTGNEVSSVTVSAHSHASAGGRKRRKVDVKMETQIEDQSMEEMMMVKEDGLEHNAWKCRLYRARRKRKLDSASSELDILEEKNKRLKLTHEKMLSNIQKIRKYYIQSIQEGSFNIEL